MAIEWEQFKKELLKKGDITHEGLMLAGIKLQLSELFYDLRKKHRMSQKQLANLIGVSQPYIARIEDGEENLTIETMAKLLIAFKTCFKIDAISRHSKKEIVMQFHIAA